MGGPGGGGGQDHDFSYFKLPNTADIHDNEALVVAAKSGDTAAVSNLLSLAGIEVDYKKLGEDTTPLGHASGRGHIEVVKLLLQAGANALITGDRGS